MTDVLSTLILALAAAWRIAFLAVGTPIMGAVLLLAIARVTGADWWPFDPLAAKVGRLIPVAALLGLCALPNPAPAHLALWMSWWGIGLRALIATTALALASARLRSGADVTLAAIILAVTALLITPIASDWMLSQAPGHPVSAIGMMLFTQSLAGATAFALAAELGSVEFRRDMARLMIAAVLGLGYLAYMDYLIVWYGNLPSRVGFYAERSAPAQGFLVCAALAAGILAPIGLLWQSRARWSERMAGLGVLAALFLFDAWWIGGGVLALLLGLLLTCGPATIAARRHLARADHA